MLFQLFRNMYDYANPVLDIYISVISSEHMVATKGFWLATVSTTVETANPEAELQPGLDLLGPIEQK